MKTRYEMQQAIVEILQSLEDPSLHADLLRRRAEVSSDDDLRALLLLMESHLAREMRCSVALAEWTKTCQQIGETVESALECAAHKLEEEIFSELTMLPTR